MRIFLAPLDSTDMGLCRSWRNDYRIMAWTRQFDFISDADQVKWFNRQSEDPTIRMYKVMLEKDEKATPVGVCGLTSIDHVNRRAEFSLYVAPDLHGRGIGQTALKALLLHGFMNVGLNLIWGETFEGNPAAKMFEKVGFKKEGTRRQFYFRDGGFIDAHLYSITAEEFYATRTHHQPGDQPPTTGGGDVVHLPSADPEGSDKPHKRRNPRAARKAGEAEASGQV